MSARTKAINDASDHGEESDLQSLHSNALEPASEGSDGSDTDDDIHTGSPYNALLQILKPASTSTPPPAKRRKIRDKLADSDGGLQPELDQAAKVPLEPTPGATDTPGLDDAEVDSNADSNAENDGPVDLEDDTANEPLAHDPFNMHFNPSDDLFLRRRIEDIKRGEVPTSKVHVEPVWKALAYGPAALSKHTNLVSLNSLGVSQS